MTDTFSFPLLARFRVGHNVIPFPHYKKVYFEIWDTRPLPKRGREILVKFYDYKKETACLEWFRVYTFCRLFYGKPHEGPESIYVRKQAREDPKSRKWIRLDKILHLLPENKFVLEAGSGKGNHEDFCMVCPFEQNRPSKKQFYHNTGNFGYFREAYSEISRENMTNSVRNRPKKSIPSRRTVIYPVDDFGKPIMDLNKAMQETDSSEDEQFSKKKPTRRRSIQPWSDIYADLELSEPTRNRVLADSITINYLLEGRMHSVRVTNPSANACRVPGDHLIKVMCGKSMNEGKRTFIFNLYNPNVDINYQEKFTEEVENLYYTLIIDTCCRFLKLPRPESAGNYLASDPTLLNKDRPIKKQSITVDTLKRFVEELQLEEIVEKKGFKAGLHSNLNSKRLWSWMLQKLCIQEDIQNLVLSPRVAACLRWLLYEKLKNTKT